MRISVIGSGTYGITLSNLLDGNGHQVVMYTPFIDEAVRLREDGENKQFLPGVQIPTSVRITSDPEFAIYDRQIHSNIITLAMPSIHLRSTLERLKPFITKEQIIVIASKGFEEANLLTLSQVVEELLPENPVCALSGPTHAEELAHKMPTACVSASKDETIAKMVQDTFMNDYFRIYTNTDILGVEIAGALKNVIALACGMAAGMGRGFGDNTKAALMTRGLKEILDIGVAMGADPMTFHGLTGMGDLIVTCTSMHSRNMRAGMLLGEGYSLKEATEKIGMVIEGANAASSALKLAQKHGVVTPIIAQVNHILRGEQTPMEALNELMDRPRSKE